MSLLSNWSRQLVTVHGSHCLWQVANGDGLGVDPEHEVDGRQSDYVCWPITYRRRRNFEITYRSRWCLVSWGLRLLEHRLEEERSLALPYYQSYESYWTRRRTRRVSDRPFLAPLGAPLLPGLLHLRLPRLPSVGEC